MTSHKPSLVNRADFILDVNSGEISKTNMLDTFYVYKKLLNIFPKSSLYGLNYQYILNADVASISIQPNSV